MTKGEFDVLYHQLSPTLQARLLASLSHDLTIVARSYDGPEGREALSGILVALNELQHQITAQIGHLIGNEERYPDDVFVEILFEHAEKSGLMPAFLRSIERVTASPPG